MVILCTVIWYDFGLHCDGMTFHSDSMIVHCNGMTLHCDGMTMCSDGMIVHCDGMTLYSRV